MSSPQYPLPPYDEPHRHIMRVELLVMLFVAAVPGLVFGLSGITDPQEVDTDVSVLTLIASVLAGLGPAAIAVYLLWRDRVLEYAGFAKPRFWGVVGYGLLALVTAVGAVFAAAVVIGAILQSVGYEPPTRDAAEFSGGYLAAALALSITAGISEEIVYRAYAITRMELAGLARGAIWVPWAAWTAQHLYQGPIALVIVGAVGAPFVWIFRWRRSVWPLMLAHALYDIGIFIISAQF